MFTQLFRLRNRTRNIMSDPNGCRNHSVNGIVSATPGAAVAFSGRPVRLRPKCSDRTNAARRRSPSALTSPRSGYPPSGRSSAEHPRFLRTQHPAAVIPRLGKVALQQLAPEDLDGFYAELLDGGRRDGGGGLSHKTVRYIHGRERGCRPSPGTSAARSTPAKAPRRWPSTPGVSW